MDVEIWYCRWDDLGSRLDGGFAGPEYDGCVFFNAPAIYGHSKVWKMMEVPIFQKAHIVVRDDGGWIFMMRTAMAMVWLGMQ